MTFVDLFHLSEDGDNLLVSNLSIRLNAEATELERRIVAALKEAVSAWEANPEGDIQFASAMLGRRYVGRLPVGN